MCVISNSFLVITFDEARPKTKRIIEVLGEAKNLIGYWSFLPDPDLIRAYLEPPPIDTHVF